MSIQRNVTRREFHANAGLLLLGGAVVVPLVSRKSDAAENAAAGKKGDTKTVCNFQASFMTWDIPYRKDPRPFARHDIPHGNMARIQLESLIDVIDRQTGHSQQFVLIAPCRTEWVYAEDHLFQIPSAEYRNIYSLTQQRSMSRRITHSGGSSSGRIVADRFRSLKIEVQPFHHARVLKTSAEIVEATAANVPLVARTQLDDPAGKHRYVLEYPVKTMNFQPKDNSFQVDTGPLLVPDFKIETKQAIDRLEMAHVAYNRFDRAEFILRRPTPINDKNGQPVSQVLHYSESVEHSATNVLLAGEV